MPSTDEAGLLERHVEKIVLLLTAVVLVPLLLVLWVFRSPYEIKLVPPHGVALPQRAYRPDEVDEALRQLADRVRELLERERPYSEPVRPWAEEIDRRFADACPGLRLTPLKAGSLALKPPEEIPVEKAKLASLLPLPAPEKPKVAAYREMLVIPPPEPTAGGEGAAAPAEAGARGPGLKEVIAAHIVAVFAHGKLRQQWREALKKTRVVPTFVVLAVEVQRRQRLASGRWGPPEPVSLFRVPAEPSGGAVTLPKFDGRNHDEVLAAAYQYADPRVRKWLLEPEYHNLYLHRQEVSWLVHKPRTRVSDLAETPAGPTAGPTVPRRVSPSGRRRYAVPPEVLGPPRSVPPAPPRRTTPRRTPPSPRRSFRRAIPPREDMYGPEGPGYRVLGRSVRRSTPPRRMPPSGRLTEVPKRPVPARRPAPVAPRPSEPAAPGVPEIVAAVPDLEVQLNHPQGILELWAHDTALDEAVEYSYRVRLVLLNPLFGKLKGVEKPADANKLQLTTPWSEWSEPVLVRRAAQFFLTGTNPQQEMVAVRVYTQKWGQVVAENFNVRRGEPIGRKVTKRLETFGGELRETEVNFETGAVAVDFDFARRVRVPNSSIVRDTTEMIYLDAEGRLRSRTLFADQISERRKELEAQLAQAAAAAAAGP